MFIMTHCSWVFIIAIVSVETAACSELNGLTVNDLVLGATDIKEILSVFRVFKHKFQQYLPVMEEEKEQKEERKGRRTFIETVLFHRQGALMGSTWQSLPTVAWRGNSH